MVTPGKVLENQAKTPSRSGLHAGRYELLSRLAAGGMGEVFIARQTSEGAFEKRVALKLLLPHLSQEQEFVHMFLDEARIAARMNHPNIVQIFDLGVAEGRYFIAMALVEGASLSRLLSACRARQTPLPLPIVRHIANGLCAGLAYAHELRGPAGESRGIIHRDVNPSNVLVSTAGAVLLTDFGIAKAQDNLHRTRPGDVKGKYAYMAPEQMKAGVAVDHRADLFAMGVTLFEALTLISPFARSTDADTIEAVRSAPVPDPLTARSDLTPEIIHALTRSLSKEPAERYGSARELRDALMDGPTASPHELGEWVEMFCAAELAAFRGGPSAPLQEVGTRSLAQGTRTKTRPPELASAQALLEEPRVKRHLTRQAALGYGFLVGVLLVLGVVALRWLLPRATSVPPPAAPVIAQPSAHAEPVLANAEPEEPAGPDAVPVEEAREPAREDHRVRSHGSRKLKAPAVRVTDGRDDGARVGYLSADATPWADIYVEGQQVDRTPLSRYPLSAGQHLLVFKNPELGKEVKKRVTIEEGKVSTLRVDFAE